MKKLSDFINCECERHIIGREPKIVVRLVIKMLSIRQFIFFITENSGASLI